MTRMEFYSVGCQLFSVHFSVTSNQLFRCQILGLKIYNIIIIIVIIIFHFIRFETKRKGKKKKSKENFSFTRKCFFVDWSNHKSSGMGRYCQYYLALDFKMNYDFSISFCKAFLTIQHPMCHTKPFDSINNFSFLGEKRKEKDAWLWCCFFFFGTLSSNNNISHKSSRFPLTLPQFGICCVNVDLYINSIRLQNGKLNFNFLHSNLCALYSVASCAALNKKSAAFVNGVESFEFRG